MPDPFLTTLFTHKAWCDRQLVAALKAAPAQAREGENRRAWATAVFTFDHTRIVDAIFRARLEGREPAETEVVAGHMPDLDALGEALAEGDAWFLSYVARATPEQLAEPVDFAFVEDGSPGRMTRGEMLAHVITHGASHRGAVGKMLELLGVRGASDMVTTFVREERER
jgi:uncharacterized damage-inducible protein DinB